MKDIGPYYKRDAVLLRGTLTRWTNFFSAAAERDTAISFIRTS
jgi:hypothetical protein